MKTSEQSISAQRRAYRFHATSAVDDGRNCTRCFLFLSLCLHMLRGTSFEILCGCGGRNKDIKLALKNPLWRKRAWSNTVFGLSVSHTAPHHAKGLPLFRLTHTHITRSLRMLLSRTEVCRHSGR